MEKELENLTDGLLPWEHVEEPAADRVVVFEGGDEVGVRGSRGGAGGQVRGHRRILDSCPRLDLGWGGTIFSKIHVHMKKGFCRQVVARNFVSD